MSVRALRFALKLSTQPSFRLLRGRFCETTNKFLREGVCEACAVDLMIDCIGEELLCRVCNSYIGRWYVSDSRHQAGYDLLCNDCTNRWHGWRRKNLGSSFEAWLCFLIARRPEWLKEETEPVRGAREYAYDRVYKRFPSEIAKDMIARHKSHVSRQGSYRRWVFSNLDLSFRPYRHGKFRWYRREPRKMHVDSMRKYPDNFSPSPFRLAYRGRRHLLSGEST